MTKPKSEHSWKRYLDLFGREWTGRHTRLGVFEPNREVAQDYWLECGLPFDGWTLDAKGEHPTLNLLLGRLRHEIKAPRRVSFHLTRSGDEDGIDVVDSEGRTTVLRFEN